MVPHELGDATILRLTLIVSPLLTYIMSVLGLCHEHQPINVLSESVDESEPLLIESDILASSSTPP